MVYYSTAVLCALFGFLPGIIIGWKFRRFFETHLK